MEGIITNSTNSGTATSIDNDNNVHCEAGFKGTELKHFDIPQECTFEHLLGTVVKAFLLDQVQGEEEQAEKKVEAAKLKYIDEDGDEVTFDTTEELKQAILMAQASTDRCLRLDVSALLDQLAKQSRERRHHHGHGHGHGRRVVDEEERKQRALLREEKKKHRKQHRDHHHRHHEERKSCKGERKCRKAERMLDEVDESTRKDWEEMLKKLNELGFDKPVQNVKLIRRYCLTSAGAGQQEAAPQPQEGGLEQVVRVLSERKQRKLERQERKQKRAREEEEGVILVGEGDEKISLRKGCKERKCKDKKKKEKKERKKRRCSKHSGSAVEGMAVVGTEEHSDSGSSTDSASTSGSSSDEKPWTKKRSGLREEGYLDLPFSQSADEVLKVWPEQVTHLFLDGNNMLFLTNGLRRFTLQRGARHIAEDALTAIAEAFAQAMAKGAKPLKQTVMIYDHISTSRCSTKQLDGEAGSFITCSARPAFATSDDQLVEWAKANRDLAAKSLYVTSDRELKDRLVAAGALVVKPKSWFTSAVKVVSQAQGWSQDLSLDDFVAKWIHQ